ncbi:MAG: hypothetical protein E7342_04090 [Clostridiales bacterium]|nr:hypothetical protein [Clostridiales bacterium]
MVTGNFYDLNVWSFIVIIAILCGAVLLANVLKRFIKPLRESLIPNSVLGGIILLIISTVCYFVFDNYLFNLPLFNLSKEFSGMQTLEVITYHALAIGFIAMGMRTTEKKLTKARSGEIFDTGVLTVATYLIQVVVGLIITIIASFIIMGIIPAGGILLAFGFGQGTGQALNYGTIYQQDFGFQGGGSFGLTIAALGFLAAAIGGVIFLNVMKKRGKIKLIGKDIGDKEEFEGENEIFSSGSMDKLTVQIGAVMLVYALSFGLMYGISALLGDGVRNIIFGFNFLIGTVLTIPVKAIIKKLRAKGVMKKEYINNFMMNRIGGFAFDVMIVAGIGAIQLHMIKDYWLVLIIMALLGTIVTFIYTRLSCNKLFKGYADEQFLASYGMLTGTASTGMILLREIDPDLKTPASENLVYQNLPAIAFGFPIMILANLAPQSPMMTYIVLGIVVVLFVLLNIILFRRSIFRKKIKE